MKRITLLMCILAHMQSYGQNGLQSLLNTYKDSISGYGIVALTDNGKQIETASIGEAYDGKSISVNQRFCIGSCTKMFTATLILKLHEQKVLSVEDSLSKYLPAHPFIDESITIKQLLNHTSGIKDVVNPDLLNEALMIPRRDFSDTYLLSLIDTVDFEKGTRYKYSNSNYFLLRKIIEVATDKPYEAVLSEIIIDPLEMTNTLTYHSNQIENLTHPMIQNTDYHSYSKFGVNSISRGVGNIVSTPKDVNTFIRALFLDHRILSDETLDLMTDFYTYEQNEIGLGMFQEEFGNRTVWGHTGAVISYISYAFVDPQANFSVVLINNNFYDTYIDVLIDEICKVE